GSAVGGRDPERQAILHIRGKSLNVEKARLDRALSSDTIRSLITAFGTGIGEDFDISKLRYGKIVIMADADETFAILMGDDVEQRRSFIQRNASDVRFLDI
ncbi:MAG: hypothetical protein ACFN4K_10245, partial [Pauljensenia sp.]